MQSNQVVGRKNIAKLITLVDIVTIHLQLNKIIISYKIIALREKYLIKEENIKGHKQLIIILISHRKERFNRKRNRIVFF